MPANLLHAPMSTLACAIRSAITMPVFIVVNTVSPARVRKSPGQARPGPAASSRHVVSHARPQTQLIRIFVGSQASLRRCQVVLVKSLHGSDQIGPLIETKVPVCSLTATACVTNSGRMLRCSAARHVTRPNSSLLHGTCVWPRVLLAVCARLLAGAFMTAAFHACAALSPLRGVQLAPWRAAACPASTSIPKCW